MEEKNEKYLEKAKKNLFVNDKERIRILKIIALENNFEFFVKNICKDLCFFEVLSLYDVNYSEYFDIESTEIADEITFKKYLSSQNIFLRNKALDFADSFYVNDDFIIERFLNEKDEEILLKFLEKYEFSNEVLLEKLRKLQNDTVAGVILKKLKNENLKDDDFIENPKYKVLYKAKIYPDKFKENVINYFFEEENYEILTFLSELLPNLTIDGETLEKITARLENLSSADKNEKPKEEIFEFTEEKVKNYLDKFEVLKYEGKVGLVSEILKNYEKFYETLIEKIFKHELYDFYITVKSLFLKSDYVFKNRILLFMGKYGVIFDYEKEKIFYDEFFASEDEEFLYNFLKVSDLRNEKLVKKIKRKIKKSDILKKRLLNLV
jgi:hypothetical protein